MSFPVVFKVIDDDYAEVVLQTDYEPINLKDWMNLVAFYSTVDAQVKFNSLDDPPKTFLAGLTYNYFMPIKIIYAKRLGEESGILYVWAEKIVM